MNMYINAEALRARILRMRDQRAAEQAYGWEWEYNGFNFALQEISNQQIAEEADPHPVWMPLPEPYEEDIQ